MAETMADKSRKLADLCDKLAEEYTCPHQRASDFQHAVRILESKADFDEVEPGIWEMHFLAGSSIDKAMLVAFSLHELTNASIWFRFNDLIVRLEPADDDGGVSKAPALRTLEEAIRETPGCMVDVRAGSDGVLHLCVTHSNGLFTSTKAIFRITGDRIEPVEG